MLHLPITLTFIGAFDVNDHLCLKNGWTQFISRHPKKLRFNNTSQIIKGKIIGFFFFFLAEKSYWYFVLSKL